MKDGIVDNCPTTVDTVDVVGFVDIKTSDGSEG
jgi:hypothetical protein